MRWVAAVCLVGLAACMNVPPPPEAAASIVVRFPDPPPPETSQDISGFRAGDYLLDRRHTTVTWRVRHYGLSMFVARFDREQGTLTLDPDDPTASRLDVTVDVDSVSTGVLSRDGERAFDREVAAVLGVADHPQITFTSTEIVRTGPDSGLLRGLLSMNGVTQPVTLDARFTGGDVKDGRGVTILAFSARTTIRRSDFGIAPDWNDFVGDDVEILIEAEFGRTDQPAPTAN